jgi:hypothetical protein
MGNGVISFLRNTFQDRFRSYLIISLAMLGIVLIVIGQQAMEPINENPGQPPIVEALLVEAEHKYLKETASGYMVGEGREFRIQCTASHPDDLELSYNWECEGGEVSEISEDGSTIIWTAPYTRVELTVTVTVSDIYGNMVSQPVALEVVSCSRFG